MEKDKETKETLAMAVLEHSKRDTMKWFVISILSIAALIGTNAYWIYTFNSYDYVSQDGEGINNINTGDQGDLENGTESQD